MSVTASYNDPCNCGKNEECACGDTEVDIEEGEQ